jgi:hypothetical protein
MDPPEGIPASKLTRKRSREARRSFATAELPLEKVEAVRTSLMNTRHDHLDRLLDPK